MADRREQRSRPVDKPEPGYFRMRLVRHGPHVPAQICRGNGEWWAIVNGERYAAHVDPAHAPMVLRIWHGADFITRAEYDLMLRRTARAAADPDHPLSKPHEPVDLTRLPSIF